MNHEDELCDDRGHTYSIIRIHNNMYLYIECQACATSVN